MTARLAVSQARVPATGRVLLALACAVALVACGESGPEEAQAWMAQERAKLQPKVPPLPEPRGYLPESFAGDPSNDPFLLQRLSKTLRPGSGPAASSSALIAPELQRRKEALEAVPLPSIAMVGSLVRSGQPIALVRVDGLLYQVRVGNYLGQNYGRVTRITENELVLREIVQDAAGEWTERVANLVLQEGSK